MVYDGGGGGGGGEEGGERVRTVVVLSCREHVKLSTVHGHVVRQRSLFNISAGIQNSSKRNTIQQNSSACFSSGSSGVLECTVQCITHLQSWPENSDLRVKSSAVFPFLLHHARSKNRSEGRREGRMRLGAAFGTWAGFLWPLL